MEHKRKAQGEGQVKGQDKAGDVDDGTSTSNEQPPPKRARPTSVPSELPDVNGIILTEFVERYLPKTCSNDADKVYILYKLVNELCGNSRWKNVLNLKFTDLRYCENAVTNDAELGNIVGDCFKTSDWKALFEDPRLRRRLSSSGDITKYFKEAFETDYCTPRPDILLRIMDTYNIHTEYYNRSFPVVQSSGMGKSRLMDHSATLRFTIPFVIHEEMDFGAETYPPFDHQVREFLTTGFEYDVDTVTRPLVFLQALFSETVAELQSYKKGTPQEIAGKWYEWMKDGSTVDSVGTNRTMFYDRVVEKARELKRSKPANHQELLKRRAEALITVVKSFVNRLEELYDRRAEFSAIVYFDEAHTLFSTSNGPHNRTPYYALMRVLHIISNERIFFVFLSTDPILIRSTDFKPPTVAKAAWYPSIRVQKSNELIPPFFELPFNAFCRGFTTQAKEEGKLTLVGVCELGQMAKFGRSMWYAYCQSLPKAEKGKTIDLAVTKLRGGASESSSGHHADLAALDLRVHIEFDGLQRLSRTTQDELVKSHMRCVCNIPGDREYVETAYLSEPVLSEAAGRILNSDVSIVDKAPDILEDALKTGLLAQEERRQLVARTLLTVAHDEAAKLDSSSTFELLYHRPIRLVVFLEKLLAPEIWESVRHATPVHAYKDDPELEVAFANTWLNFSHFVRLGDPELFNLQFASELLKRGAAMQTYNQQNQDVGIPLHNGDPTSMISLERTSMAQIKVLNIPQRIAVSPNPSLIGECHDDLPILSVSMQLGVEKFGVEIMTTQIDTDTPSANTPSSASTAPVDIERRHYSIVLYGCTADTYSCVGNHESKYQKLLQKPNCFDDYSRRHNPDLLDAVRKLASELNDIVWRN
ncbi:hypothetical protein E1B28_010951 [Marasmius oreades]|uniref:Uncharacterized protein n=1 Tax=Marasmius oreades TaxID=181124 RepID=A0A9P7UP11_9AGAR|nr:uncharacterized protein E1B28_010951 [Marasmius oreades]KAG7089252.1 hypothetical protein E1B28_010951 [Marasmius oreades]